MTRCDFCSVENPSPEYFLGANTFELAVLPGVGSLGDWCACEACAELINADDWDGIIQRAYDGQADWIKASVPEPELKDFLREMYTQLRGNCATSATE